MPENRMNITSSTRGAMFKEEHFKGTTINNHLPVATLSLFDTDFVYARKTLVRGVVRLPLLSLAL